MRFNCLLLLLCDDILPNPGPLPRYPCGVCRCTVHPSDKALLCDSCVKWFHVECTRVLSEEYDHYITLDQLIGHVCYVYLMFYHLMMFVILILSLHSLMYILLIRMNHYYYHISKESMTADLCVVHHNVQGLLSKFTEISQRLHISYGSNLIVCCSETWLQGDKVPATPGFVSYCSPLLKRLTGKKLLPGSCMFVSYTLIPSHPEICDIVEQSTTCLMSYILF